MYNVTVIKENRNLVVEHLQIDHPLSKGDTICVTHDNDFKEYEVIKCTITIGKQPKKSVGKLFRTEIIVKEIN